MIYDLYIDDIRLPKTGSWIIARDYVSAVRFFEEAGCPASISFDHDLGKDSKSGYDIAKYIVEKDLDKNGKFIPANFSFNVHSANPVGAKNIKYFLNGYLSWKRAAMGL